MEIKAVPRRFEKTVQRSIGLCRSVNHTASVNRKKSPIPGIGWEDRYKSGHNEHFGVKVGLGKYKVFHPTTRDLGRVIGVTVMGFRCACNQRKMESV